MPNGCIVIQNIESTEALIENYELRQKLFSIDHLPEEMQLQISAFLDGLIVNNKQFKTIKSYFSDVKMLAEYLSVKKGYESFANVSPLDYMMYKRYLQAERRNKLATIERKTVAYKMFFAHLVENGLAENTPIAQASAIKASRKKEEREIVYLTADEAWKLIQTINLNPKAFYRCRDAILFFLFLKTGMRISEIRAIDVEDFDWLTEKNSISVQGKGSKTRKIPIYISDEEKIMFDEVASTYLSMRNEIVSESEKAFFVSKKKKRLCDESIQRCLKKYIKKAGIEKKITPHKLRHTYATILAQNNVGELIIKELLGHSSIATTQIYTHMNERGLEEAVKTKGLIIGGKI